jgi:hypothetical protein
MTAYDNWKTTDTQADRLAKDDAARAALRESIEITPQELGECLSILTDEQFHQFCDHVLQANDYRLRYVVRELVCGGVLDEKVRKHETNNR